MGIFGRTGLLATAVVAGPALLVMNLFLTSRAIQDASRLLTEAVSPQISSREPSGSQWR
jgi:hypothetical protein